MALREFLHIPNHSRDVLSTEVDQQTEEVSEGVGELEAALHGSPFETTYMDSATILRIVQKRAALALHKVGEKNSVELITRRNQ